MSEKYRVHELVRFHYSDIGEYVDEHHTDRPLRNDILVDVLNEQDKSINELKSSNHSRTKIIIRLTDKINQLEKENEQLKEELESFEQVYFTDLYDGSRTVLYMKKENGDSE